LCWAMGVEILYDVMYIGIYSGDVSRYAMHDKQHTDVSLRVCPTSCAVRWYTS
jgi:hypothetical protein